MEKYALEIENWGEWELEKDFSDSQRALAYGFANLQNHSQWRVIDRTDGRVVYTNTNYIQEAQSELDRFRETERWRTILGNRNISRPAQVARNQRDRQHELNNARRQRIRGFRFEGNGPIIPNDSFFGETLSDFPFLPKKKNFEKVNWQKEGF